MQSKNTKSTIYSVWKQKNLSTPERSSILALDPLGSTAMTYAEMDIAVQACGVALNVACDEEIITHCGLMTVDAILTLWSANAVGKAVNFVTPELIIADPVGYIESLGSKTLVVLDIFYPSIADSLRKIKLERVIIASLADYAKTKIDEVLPDDYRALLLHSQFEDIKKNASADVGYEIISWKEFISIGEGRTLSEYELSGVAKDDVVGIFYTGGSTGAPKGIQLTNESILTMCDICRHHDAFDYAVGDRHLAQIPPCHATATVLTLIEPMMSGCTMAVVSLYDMERTVEDFRLAKPNHLIACTNQLLAITKCKDLKEGELRFLKKVKQGGEKLYDKDAVKINRALQYAGAQDPLKNGYGMSELGPMTMIGDNGSMTWMLAGHSVEHELLDQHGNVIEGDGVGMLRTRTPARMLSYRNNPEATKEFFDDNGWGYTQNVTERKTFDDGIVRYDVMGRDSDKTAFTDKNGKRVFGAVIDRFVAMHEDIFRFQTVALPVSNREETHVFVVHMVFEPEFSGDKNVFLRKLILDCGKEFTGAMMPAGFKVYENSLPINAGMKKLDIDGMASDYDGYYNLVDGKLVKVNFQ